MSKRTLIAASTALLTLVLTTKESAAQSMMWEPSAADGSASPSPSAPPKAPVAALSSPPATTTTTSAAPEATSATATPAPNEQGTKTAPSRGVYFGAGAFYLPVDSGLTAAAVIGGVAIKASDTIDLGIGGRIGYGESRYSSALVFTPEVHIYRWWGHYGLGLATGVGLIAASRKGTTGWDGALAGVMATASPVRLRFGKIEPSLDVGILYAVGQAYPAPFIMPSMTARF